MVPYGSDRYVSDRFKATTMNERTRRHSPARVAFDRRAKRALRQEVKREVRNLVVEDIVVREAEQLYLSGCNAQIKKDIEAILRKAAFPTDDLMSMDDMMNEEMIGLTYLDYLWELENERKAKFNFGPIDDMYEEEDWSLGYLD